MGTKYNFKCNKCGYSVVTSGGHDFGMMAVTNTYICKNCKKIVDVIVGEYGVTLTKEAAIDKKKKNEIDLNFYSCPECGSDKHLINWDITKRVCPKCDGYMNEDLSVKILWD